MAKLTLSVEESVVDRAKEYAAARGTSVSRLVEDYLRLIADGPGYGERADTPADPQCIVSSRSCQSRYVLKRTEPCHVPIIHRCDSFGVSGGEMSRFFMNTPQNRLNIERTASVLI